METTTLNQTHKCIGKNSCGKIKPLSEFYQNWDKNKCGGKYYYRWRCKDCEKIYVAQKTKTPKGRNTYLKRQFGISYQEYQSLFLAQNSACAICKKQVDYNLCVDHDHNTGQVRGLLCRNCNSGIGKLGDTLEALESALAYLKNFQKIL